MGKGTGGARSHAFVRRAFSFGAATATAAAMLFIVASNAAASPVAQFNFGAIICPILLALRGLFGGFLSGIIDSLLAAFGCSVPSGG